METAEQIEQAHEERLRRVERVQNLSDRIGHIERYIEKRGQRHALLIAQGKKPTRIWKERVEPYLRDGLRQTRQELQEALQDLQRLPTCRCGARTRGGGVCQRVAIAGRRRCLLHGGKSTGPRTPEGREKIAQANRARGTVQEAQQGETVRQGGAVPPVEAIQPVGEGQQSTS